MDEEEFNCILFHHVLGETELFDEWIDNLIEEWVKNL